MSSSKLPSFYYNYKQSQYFNYQQLKQMYEEPYSVSIVDQVLSSAHFRLMLKEIVHEISYDQKEKEVSTSDEETSAEAVAEELTQHMEVLMRDQAERQVRIAEELISQFYDLKRRQFEDQMLTLMQAEFKKLADELREEIENFGSCYRPSHVSMNQSNQECESATRKRQQLKEMILNDSSHSSNCEQKDNSKSSPSLQLELNMTKLSQQVQQLNQEVKKSLKKIHEKLHVNYSQCRESIVKVETGFRDQLQGSLEGIWNVISNLEKRILLGADT